MAEHSKKQRDPLRRRPARRAERQRSAARDDATLPAPEPARHPAHRFFIARLANHWFVRIMGAINDRNFEDQLDEFEAHRTTRDFIWNSVGVGLWGFVFPILTIIATQLAGVEAAGMFSMAFVTGTLLMIIANFGVRTYQVSDIDERHSFIDYQVNRWITCVLMVIVGVVYCSLHGYDAEMFYLSIGVYFYRMVDGLADVYEGRLQQADKLYLAGISQAIRSVCALIIFAVVLFITGSMVAAAYGMAIVAAFLVITLPLTYVETPRSGPLRWASVRELFRGTAPLFVALFLYALVDNMPKFVMEGALSYDNQLYFNALYFPAQFILIVAQLIYRPLLVRMADVWSDDSKRASYDRIVYGILAAIITLVSIVFMVWLGIPILSFLYGIDFEPFRGWMIVMLVAGGVTAAIDWFYQLIIIMRRQKDVTKLYLVAFGFSLFVPWILIMIIGLGGAVISYLVVMSLLFVLLLLEYFRIRKDLRDNYGF